VSFVHGLPFPVAVGSLFVIVMLRANATYWLGRGAEAGAEHTRLIRLLSSPRFERVQRVVARWGAPIVTLCFLTIGIQTLVNLAAGVTKMPLRRYLPAVVIGSVLWALLYATFGFVTFVAWRRLYELSPAGAIGSAAALVAGLGIYLWWQLKHRPEANA
jgi:membrane protein DedA with SNARE-associated domain